MSDLISRADAIEAIQTAYCTPCKERGDDYNEVRCRACDYDNAIMQIDALPSADAEWTDCTDFVNWLTEVVMDEGNWELNAVAYGEIICRKLEKLGVLEVTEEPSYYIRPSADAVQGAGRYENAMQKLREMPRYLNGVKEKQITKISDDAVQGEWEDREVFNETDDDHIIEEWQSARCSVCGKYHTTPYMYYFDDFNFCPNCGAKMKGGDKE